MSENPLRRIGGFVLQNSMEERKKVLITGAAGRIGSSLRVLMKDRYRLRLMFHSKVLPVEEDEEVVIGDLCDFEKMPRAKVTDMATCRVK